jgi:hypothetical protein
VYTLFKSILFAHIVVAFFGLVVFWIPIFARKGERVHVRAGKVFLYAAYFVGASAFTIATMSIVSPFGTHPDALPSDPADIAAAVTGHRSSGHRDPGARGVLGLPGDPHGGFRSPWRALDANPA